MLQTPKIPKQKGENTVTACLCEGVSVKHACVQLHVNNMQVWVCGYECTLVIVNACVYGEVCAYVNVYTCTHSYMYMLTEELQI